MFPTILLDFNLFFTFPLNRFYSMIICFTVICYIFKKVDGFAAIFMSCHLTFNNKQFPHVNISNQFKLNSANIQSYFSGERIFPFNVWHYAKQIFIYFNVKNMTINIAGIAVSVFRYIHARVFHHSTTSWLTKLVIYFISLFRYNYIRPQFSASLPLP